MNRILPTLTVAAAAVAGAVSAPVPASAQTWWTPRVVVNAGTGLLIVGEPFGPPVIVAVPVLTTARPVTAGPVERVSGCYWARERNPGGGWIRYRVCS